MSGAMLAGSSGRDSRQVPGDAAPRRNFGTRVVARNRGRETVPGASEPHSVDCGVADMRRRIDASQPAVAGRVAWAVATALLCGASLALWFGAFKLASMLVRELAHLF